MPLPKLDKRGWLVPVEVARLCGLTKYQLKRWRRAQDEGVQMGPKWYEIAVPGHPSNPRYNKIEVVKWAVENGFPLPPGKTTDEVVSWLLIDIRPDEVKEVPE